MKRKDALNDVSKEYKKLIASGKEAEAAKLFPKLQQAIDKAAKRGIIKKNTADRKKSRASKKIAKK